MRNYTCSKIDLVTRCYFGGGGSPSAPPPMPEFKPPPMPPAPPPPPPPPEMQNMSAGDAANQQRTNAANRSGFRKSILAGETGGYVNPATGANSLLG
jgi:hypothetical protein